jgi:hypothetical protein
VQPDLIAYGLLSSLLSPKLFSAAKTDSERCVGA